MTDCLDNLLSRYPRHIAFLRGQLQKSKLRLALGAGVSIPIGFPGWPELVSRIAKEIKSEDVIAGRVQKASLTAKVQYLQNVFVQKEKAGRDFFNEKYVEEESLAKWHAVLQKSLYDSVKEPAKHPYLSLLVKLLKDSKFILNYNFDDCIERLVSELFPYDKRKGKKPYDTVWSLANPLRDDVLTIYHPNGFIPSRKHEYPSDRIVFSDETFSDQILGDQIGNHSLVHHFLQNTFLLVGLSLDDISLRQHLRRMALMAPGLNHVLISNERPDELYSDEQKRTIEKANFEVYNLLTMFLTPAQVTALIELLSESADEFKERSERLGVSVKFTFYLTGGVGAGKTTSVNQFGSCNSYDEWVEESPDIISKPFNDLSLEEKNDADRWIERQFALKNRAIRNLDEGIHVVDRCPLDPLAFEKGGLQKRANQLKGAIRPGVSNVKIEEGHIILLDCPSQELQRRLISKNKHWSVEAIEGNVNRLRNLYEPKSTIVDSYDNDVVRMSKAISRIIFVEDYNPSDIDGLLMGFT